MTDPWGFGDDERGRPDRDPGDRTRDPSRDPLGRASPRGSTLRDLVPDFLLTAALFAGLAAVGWLLGDTFGVLPSGEAGLLAAAAVAVLILVSRGLRLRGRGIGRILMSLLAWAAIGLVAVAGYAWRDELAPVWQRVAVEFVPGAAVHGERSLTVRAAANGAFYLDVYLNERPTRMLVDTGATGLGLSLPDARRAGLDTGRLRYTVPVGTANGRAMRAPAVVDTLRIGGLTIRDARALVGRRADPSLLGMSILRRFRSFEMNGDRLTLRW